MNRTVVCTVMVLSVGFSWQSSVGHGKRAEKVKWHSVEASPMEVSEELKMSLHEDEGRLFGSSPDGSVDSVKRTSMKWRVSKATSLKPGVTIERIAGCYGDRDMARMQVVAWEEVAHEPRWEEAAFKPGVFKVERLGEAACVEYAPLSGFVKFDDQVMDESAYAYVYCGADGYEPEETDGDEASGTEGDLASEGPCEPGQYAQYKAGRQAEIAKGRPIHETYAADYHKWDSRRAKALSGPALRMTLTAGKAMKAGRVSVYRYKWSEYRFCGELQEAERIVVSDLRLAHPALAAGETFELWLPDAELGTTWGVSFAEGDSGINQARLAAHRHLGEREDYDDSSLLPKGVRQSTAETSIGQDANVVHECCSQ